MPVKAKTVKVYRGDTTPFLSAQFFPPGSSVDPATGHVIGTPMDVSSWQWLAQWRPDADSETVLPLVVQTDQAAQGRIYVLASAATTAQMDGNGVWDLQATIPGGEIETKFFGSTTLLRDVSRS